MSAASTAVRFTLDATPPAVAARASVAIGPKGTEVVTVNDVSLDTNGVASVTLLDDGKVVGTFPAANNGQPFSGSVSLSLAEATHSLSVVATDAAGSSVTQALVPIRVDLPPTLTANESVAGLTSKTSDPVSQHPRLAGPDQTGRGRKAGGPPGLPPSPNLPAVRHAIIERLFADLIPPVPCPHCHRRFPLPPDLRVPR